MPRDMSYMYPIFPIVCFFTILLTFFPVPAHWKAGNIATVALAFWIIGGLIFCLVNTIVWHGNLRNPYPVWGDITCAYIVMVGPAIASCILCVQFRLWNIARTKRVLITPREKRRQRWLTYFLCLGFPILLIPLHYVVQGHRYNVYEDLGPMYTTHNVTLAYGIFWIIEPLVCLISSVFSILTIRLFLKQRKEFDAVLASGSNINKNRYIRLLALAATAIIVHFPLSTWLVIVNAVAYPVYPFISWEDTHSNWMRIAYISRFMISRQPNQVIYISISWWSLPAAGWFYFVFFGFGEEAMVQYRSLVRAALKPFGINWPKEETASSRRRRRTTRTWLDVILCRPGRPINLTSSMMTTSSVMPDFSTSMSHPEKSVIETSPDETTKNNTKDTDKKKKKSGKHSSKKDSKKSSKKSGSGGGQQSSGMMTDQTRSIGGGTAMMNTGAGTGDLNLDIANLDFLDPAEAKKQARISAYTRPGQAARRASAAAAVGKKKRATESFESSIGEIEEEEVVVEETKKKEEEKKERVDEPNSSDEEGDDDASSICTDSQCSCRLDDSSSSSSDEGEDITEQRRKNKVQVDTTVASAGAPSGYAASSSRSTSSLDEKKMPLETPTAAVAAAAAVLTRNQQPQERHIMIADPRERDLERGVVAGDEEEETEEEQDVRIRAQKYKEEYRAAHPDATEEITF
ncbi:a-factor receptor [Serendipita sp. 399]|nr:a-factor receptor [Serendipita sp. 399]